MIAEKMQEGAIEETVIPRNPLDVLSQQIVAVCAESEITVDELHDLVRGAYPFADLSRAQLENVLDMLAGRYPSDEFAELRPRIIWDRTAGVIRGRPGSARLAVTNAGTIPDRGLYGVHLVDGGGRVGELDEEMVYEARAGQTFLLGASTWRIEEITRDRVLVSPAPGVPGSVPFWKGEGIGRPYELGRAIGEFSRKVASWPGIDKAKGMSIQGLDERAEQNLLQFLHDQQAATGVVPSDRTVVVERFRDEIGDWRLCILTPFGARVHAPWALATAARLRDSLGLEVQSIWSDDGIAFHLPDADAPPPTDDLLIPPEEIEDLVVQEVGQSALFGARFRENAARALLIPRRRPGERTPLLAAAAEGAVAPAGRAALRLVPDRPRDVPRMPAGRVRPAGAEEAAAGSAHARARSGRRRNGQCVAVRGEPALRLHRDLHVRGRHAARRAARAGAVARPRSVARAARPGGAARSARSGRARRGRTIAATGGTQRGRAARPAPPARRPASGRVRRGARGSARDRAACVSRAHQDGGAADRGRGCGALPRRARRDAAGRAARRVPRVGRRAAALARAALRARTRPVHDARGERRTSAATSSPSCSRSSTRRSSCAASFAPAVSSASGASRTSCADCVARRSRRCAARSSRRSRLRSAASCRRGTASTGRRRCGRRSSRSRASRCR